MEITTRQKKIRIAFIKLGGLSPGGTEKFLQTIAAHLPKDQFTVDYFYSDTVPYIGSSYIHPGTDPYRKAYLESHGVNLIEFIVGAKDIRTRTHEWIDTTFWEHFDEKNYDLIQTGRAGQPEYPFYKIKKTPIVDSIHYVSGFDNQYNIARVLHMCNWNAQRWIKEGGDKKRVQIVSHPLEIHPELGHSLRNELTIEEDVTVFGFHQRNDPAIFSSIPLAAYKKIETDKTAFIILGGSDAHRQQAEELKIKHIHFLPHTGDTSRILSFLKTLNVYAHGRRDGEINSTAIGEALYFGLPVVSHCSELYNGHVEMIGPAGTVTDGVDAYALELKKLCENLSYREEKSIHAKARFQEKYELEGQMKQITEIYHDVLRIPFPHSLRRVYFQTRDQLARRGKSFIYQVKKLLLPIARAFGYKRALRVTTALTVLTDPIPETVFSTYFVKRLIAFIKEKIRFWGMRRYGGHYGVTRSLIQGLQRTNAYYNYNPLLRSNLHKNVVVLSNLEALKQAIRLKQQGYIKKLLAGPNLVILPSDASELIGAPQIDLSIVNSVWTRDMYASNLPVIAPRLTIWPAGIDETFWKPQKNTKEKLLLFYYKTGPKTLYEHTKKISEQAGFTIKEISYGSYTKEHYRSLLDQAQALVIFSESESQGLALFEAWSMNVPTFVWNQGYSLVGKHTKTFPTSAAPYLSEQTGTMFQTEADFINVIHAFQSMGQGNQRYPYHPRLWILNHGTDTHAAEHLMELLKKTTHEL